MTDPPTYLIAHLRQALLDDGRLGEQAVEIGFRDGRLHLRGEVATPERRAAVLALVADLAPEAEVIDDLRISDVAAPVSPEAEPM